MITKQKQNLRFSFFGATNYSKELLLYLIAQNIKPVVIFSIPEEFSISYSKEKIKNINFGNLREIANEYDIPYYEVDSAEGKRLKDYYYILKSFKLDLHLVLGWYYMISKDIRILAKYGAWGIHASLLPKYAGNAPLNWAIIHGEKETGVTLFRMEDGVDDGDIIKQLKFEIDYKDTIKEVYEKATQVSKIILKEVLADLLQATFTPQKKELIEVYPPRAPADGKIDWNNTASNLYNFIRAQTLPYPCAFSFINNQLIKFVEVRRTDLSSKEYRPGTLVNLNNKALVATLDDFIEIKGIINEGKTYKCEDYARNQNLWGGVFENKES